MGTTRRNFHISLPEDLDRRLSEEARRSGQAPTEIAREGIRLLLEKRQRDVIHEEITAYAKEVAGSISDLDSDLEAASIQHLFESEDR